MHQFFAFFYSTTVFFFFFFWLLGNKTESTRRSSKCIKVWHRFYHQVRRWLGRLTPPSIFSYLPPTNQCRGRQENSLGRSPVRHRAHKSLRDGAGVNLESPIALTFLDCQGKREEHAQNSKASDRPNKTFVDSQPLNLYVPRSVRGCIEAQQRQCDNDVLSLHHSPFLYFGYTGITTDWIRDYE